jgi:hypothetical protein
MMAMMKNASAQLSMTRLLGMWVEADALAANIVPV